MKSALLLTALLLATTLQAQPAQAPLGTTPSPEEFPTVEFAFEARITLAPAVVLGETARGGRQYIPITGGTIAGPLLNGRVIPGGWDFQLRMGGGCSTLTADYFLEADDGTVIHILNESMSCPPAEGDTARTYFRPKFEAPLGPHGWLTGSSFVARLELDRSPPPADEPAAEGGPPRLGAIRIKFYRIK